MLVSPIVYGSPLAAAGAVVVPELAAEPVVAAEAAVVAVEAALVAEGAVVPVVAFFEEPQAVATSAVIASATPIIGRSFRTGM
jgi:hypothetical protein